MGRGRTGWRAGGVPLCLFTATLALLCGRPATANDSPAAVAAGGIQLRREPRIRMEEEFLRISPDKVEVAYLFRNLSNREIRTEVAFPIPPFCTDFRGPGHWPAFSDFSVLVEGKPVHVDVDLRAVLDGEDRTELLSRFGLLSHHPSRVAEGLKALSQKDRGALIEMGMVEEAGEELIPLWTLDVRYHWAQAFPPWHAIRVEHSYSPVRGFYAGDLERWPVGADEVEIRMAGTPPSTGPLRLPVYRDLRRWREDRMGMEGAFSVSWVPYLLTTGANWNGPIGNFHLEVEHPPATGVAIDFEGPLLRTSRTRVEGNLERFSPKRDLTVYFFTTPLKARP